MGRIIGVKIEDCSEIYFENQAEAEKHGFTSQAVNMCLNNKRKSHKGYMWRREDPLDLPNSKLKKLGSILCTQRGTTLEKLLNEYLKEELRKEINEGNEVLKYNLQKL